MPVAAQTRGHHRARHIPSPFVRRRHLPVRSADAAQGFSAEAVVSNQIDTALVHGLFPDPVLRRTLLKTVGAIGPARRAFEHRPARHAQGHRPGAQAAGKDQAQCRLPAHHLRDAADLRRETRLLCQGRPRGHAAEDRRHRADPRQDDQWRTRRLAAGDAGRAHHERGSWRQHAVDQGADDPQPERQFARAREQAQGQPRSEELEGLHFRCAVRAEPPDDAASQLSRGRRARSRHGREISRRAADRICLEPAGRQHRRLLRRRAGRPARRVSKARASSISSRRRSGTAIRAAR